MLPAATFKRGQLNLSVKQPTEKTPGFSQQGFVSAKLRFCFCTSSVGLFSPPLAQLNILLTNRELKYVSVGKSGV